MPLRVRLMLTGSLALIAFILWLLFQTVLMVQDPLMKWGAFLVFVVLVIATVLDGLRGGVTD